MGGGGCLYHVGAIDTWGWAMGDGLRHSTNYTVYTRCLYISEKHRIEGLRLQKHDALGDAFLQLLEHITAGPPPLFQYGVPRELHVALLHFIFPVQSSLQKTALLNITKNTGTKKQTE